MRFSRNKPPANGKKSSPLQDARWIYRNCYPYALEQQLQEKEDFNRLIFSSLSTGILITDPVGNFTFVSPNIDGVFGYTVQEVEKLGNVINLFGHSLFRPEELAAEGTIDNLVCTVTDLGGKNHSALITVKRIKYKQGEILYSCTPLATQHNQHVALLNQLDHTLHAQIRELDQQKEIFLASLSHELLTPLTKIKLVLQTLDPSSPFVDKDSPTRLAQLLPLLRQETDREIRLINDLLILQNLEAKAQPLSLLSLQLQDRITYALETFREELQKRHLQLTTFIPPTLPNVISDLFIIDRILQEILTNACKFSPMGEQIDITLHATASHLVLKVTNSGVEVPAAALPRLFQPFYRIPTSDPWRYSGLGIGLALVKKLVEYVRGSVQAESGSGWFTVTVELPLTP
jgi:PAS domain S-box-containing protein